MSNFRQITNEGSMFPISVVDNFFRNPEDVVDFAKSVKYNPPRGNYPGVRSDEIKELDNDLYETVLEKIFYIFYERPLSDFSEIDCGMSFLKQESIPNPGNFQYGFIHRDIFEMLAGVIDLSEIGDSPNTTIFSCQEPLALPTNDAMLMYYKHELYTSGEVDDEVSYIKRRKTFDSQFSENVVMKNAFNRLLLFPAGKPHAVEIKPKPRLILNFFIRSFKCDGHEPLKRNYMYV